MKTFKFSVIIPNFNSEKFIEKAIKSVINQNYNNWELIVVDDGSTDNSISIIEKFTDDKISLIKTNHVGVGNARNIGIQNATGDYIIFVDSDDWIEDWIMTYLNEKLQTSTIDAFIGMFNTITNNVTNFTCRSEKIDPIMVNGKSQKDVLDYFYRLRLIFTVWRFIIKRSIFIEKNIFFSPSIYHEDELLIPQILANCKSFAAIDKPFYNYNIRDNSIMTSKNSLFRQESLLIVCQELFNLAKNESVSFLSKFYLRCCYKNLFQSYLGVRGLSEPIEPIENRFL